MAVKKGKPVRPILVDGIMGKRFKRHESIAKRSIAASIATHPSIVAHDLCRGSLASLDRYLKENPGTLDRRIANQLRKLISGSALRSRYRLVVIDHPDAPPAKGGKEREKDMAKEARDEAIVRMYDRLVDEGTKPYIATQEVGAAFEVSYRTVTRVSEGFDRSKLDEPSRETLFKWREEALTDLRSKSTGQEDDVAPTSSG